MPAGGLMPINASTEDETMLWLIVIILIIGWLLGFFVFDLGALLHILLVVAVVVLIVNLIRGRPAV